MKTTWGIMLRTAVLAAATSAWGRDPTHVPAGSLGSARDTKAQALSCFCLDPGDNILACDEAQRCIRRISPGDKLLAKWTLDFAPQAMACRADGTVLVSGGGRIALLDASGQTLLATNLPVPPLPIVKGRKLTKAEVAQQISMRTASTAVAAMSNDVFVCARSNTGYTIYRLNDRFEEPKAIVKGLSGCCGQMDFTARGDTLYVAANCEAKVVQYNRAGRKVGSFGPGREDCFKGCCEPKNLCFGPDGTLYVAESAQCCINRFTTAGKLLDRVGIVKDITGCVRVTVAVNRDASRVYMLDTDRNVIRVLQRKTAATGK